MSKAKRMMITLYEAMEDLYLLSLLDFLVGTMSSHFTTQVQSYLNPTLTTIHSIQS